MIKTECQKMLIYRKIVAWLWEHYPQEGTAKYIKDRIKQVKKWADKNKVNVWCGEIGCEPKYAAEADRVEYFKAIVSALNTYNIPYCIYGTEMFSEPKELPIFPDDIQEDVLKALNFTMPEKSLVEKTNISINDISKEPYVIFDGCVGKGTKVITCGVMKVTGDDKNPTNLFLSVSYTPGQDGHDMNIFFPENIKTQIAEDYDSLYLSFKVKFENKIIYSAQQQFNYQRIFSTFLFLRKQIERDENKSYIILSKFLNKQNILLGYCLTNFHLTKFLKFLKSDFSKKINPKKTLKENVSDILLSKNKL